MSDDAIWLNRDGWVARHWPHVRRRNLRKRFPSGDIQPRELEHVGAGDGHRYEPLFAATPPGSPLRSRPSVGRVAVVISPIFIPLFPHCAPSWKSVGTSFFELSPTGVRLSRASTSRRVEFIPWSQENEVRTIQEMSIGVMPLEDTPWARGKCSFQAVDVHGLRACRSWLPLSE
jgi:hypothetical protein